MSEEKLITSNQQQLQILPNSSIVLILGILSIFFFCLFMGLLSLVMGIIALILAQQSNRLYNDTPRLYTESSYNNLKTGKICAIIGIALAGFIIAIVITLIIFGLSIAFSVIPFCL